MAFDGLAHQGSGQIDAAIAAIAVSDARRGPGRLLSVYYVSQDAALARTDAGIIISSVESLAPYRVGVQSGSVFETWLQGAAVDTGVLPPDNMLVYTSAEQAITDLREGRVDVVIADRLPLETVAQDGELAIVGRGLNEQRFAVALAKGSNLMGPRQRGAGRAGGRRACWPSLAERYLSLEEVELVAVAHAGAGR